MNRTAPTLLVAAASIAALAGCSSSSDTATSTTLARPTTSSPAPDCKSAPAAAVSRISGALTDSKLSLANAQAVNGPEGVVYIAANIMEGEKREHSAEVWVTKDGATYSLSSNARSETSLPDGRKLLGLSAGDTYGTAAIQCVVEDLRRQNGAK